MTGSRCLTPLVAARLRPGYRRSAMPRFFFHVHDDIDTVDEDGLELADIGAAQTTAVRAARALACEQVMAGHLHLDHRIDVADEGGALIATVTFGDAVAVEG